MNKLIITSTFMAALLIGAQASAQGGGMGAPGDRPARPDFATVDADENGYLSLEEMNAGANGRDMTQFFARMDADSDEMLTEEEYSAAGGRGGQGGGRPE